MAADVCPKKIKGQIYYYSRDIDQLYRVCYAEEIKSTTEETLLIQHSESRLIEYLLEEGLASIFVLWKPYVG